MITNEQICNAAAVFHDFSAIRDRAELEPLFEAVGVDEEVLKYAVQHAMDMGLTGPGEGRLISFSVGLLFGLLLCEKNMEIEDKLTPLDEFRLLYPEGPVLEP